MNIIRLLVAAIALACVSACETTHYDLKPPASEQGRMCTVQCAGIKEACRSNDAARVLNEKAICERNSESALRTCLHRASNKEQEKECQQKRKSCYVSDDLGRCEANYRQCFAGCGGTVTEYKKPLF